MQPVSSLFFSIFAHLHKTYITASDIYRCPKSSSSPFFYSHVHSPLFVAPCHRSHSIPSQSYVRSLFYFRQHSCAGSRSSDFPYTIECDAPLRYGSTLNKHAPSLLVCGGGGGGDDNAGDPSITGPALVNLPDHTAFRLTSW